MWTTPGNAPPTRIGFPSRGLLTAVVIPRCDEMARPQDQKTLISDYIRFHLKESKTQQGSEWDFQGVFGHFRRPRNVTSHTRATASICPPDSSCNARFCTVASGIFPSAPCAVRCCQDAGFCPELNNTKAREAESLPVTSKTKLPRHQTHLGPTGSRLYSFSI